MKSRTLLLLLSLTLAAGCAEQNDAPRVGVVDIQEAFQRSPLVMVSAHQLKGILGSGGRDLKQRGRALAQLRQQLEHGGHELSADQRAQLERRLAEETARLMDEQQKHQAEVLAAQERQGAEMLARVEEMARDVAKREGLTLLLRKDGILYAEDGLDVESLDITERVARALLEKINPTEIPAEPSER